ncbi:MAG: RHS repeat-associated core domain-containing protein [Gemmatimonadaceae bacterium]
MCKRDQFTQEDPIGLAGGLNLYGFANVDPVNFSDPFGLCPCSLQDFINGVGGRLAPIQGPLEIAGGLVTAPLLGGMGMAGGISSEVLALVSTLRTGAGSGALAGGASDPGNYLQSTESKNRSRIHWSVKERGAFLNRQAAHDGSLGVT